MSIHVYPCLSTSIHVYPCLFHSYLSIRVSRVMPIHPTIHPHPCLSTHHPAHHASACSHRLVYPPLSGNVRRARSSRREIKEKAGKKKSRRRTDKHTGKQTAASQQHAALPYRHLNTRSTAPHVCVCCVQLQPQPQPQPQPLPLPLPLPQQHDSMLSPSVAAAD